MLTILFVAFLILLLLGMPIGYVLAISAAIAYITNPNLPSLVMAQKVFTATDSFSLMAIPFFMLAGHLMTEANITHSIVQFAKTLVGHITGGLAHTSCVAGMLLAGISGSANADASAIGSILVPSLIDDGYDDGFAVSLVASCGALGPIIPPSIIMIMYASVSNIPVGRLFMAGVIPGILMGLGFMGVSYVYAKKKGMVEKTKWAGWKNVWKAFKSAFWALLMPLIIIVGITTGMFTATEAGSVVCIYGLVYGLISKNLNWEKIKRAVKGAVFSTVPSMFVIAMASNVGYLMSYNNFARTVQNFLLNVSTNQYVIIAIIIGFLYILGMFVDTTASLLMIVPVLLPLIDVFGWDPLWFAIILVINLVLGGLTPPVGMLLYIVAGIKNTQFSRVCKYIWPFIGVELFVTLLIIIWPQIGTWLPTLVYNL